ncbi:Caspase-14 [Varanus komodoensis]|uniref:Caspase-14-like n=1 Tax=Varanus komodoensis TaxID=61221 RepID=A0A8D2IQ71_VARKO|nr:caspase-14-like isoform X2 [Varanus komodoensis]KAF7247681.1 Caspase-14 [Varanus komodoensis]
MEKEKIKAALSELTDKEIKKLKSDLNDFSKEEEKEGHSKIPWNVLEPLSTPYELADLLMQHYPGRAGRVTVKLLRKLPSNEEANKLENWLNTIQDKGTDIPKKTGKSSTESKTKGARNHVDISGPDLDCYDMKQKRVAFLMCMKVDRPGAEIDFEIMKKICKTFDFKTPTECIDPSLKDLKKKLQDFRETINNSDEEISCCLISLMGHGKLDDHICLKDVPISLAEVFSFFNNKEFPKLRRKPKIFIIQSCRGSNRDYGVEADDQAMVSDMINQKLPTASDYFIVYSSQPGFIAIRDKYHGSPMITTMDEVFADHGMQWHIGDLFTKVNRKMTEEEFLFTNENKPVKVSIVMESTLTKAVYLAPN